MEPDPFDPHAPARPLRPATVTGTINMIVRFASALVRRGEMEIEEITDLAVFFEIDRLKSGLKFFLERFDNKPTPYVAKLANMLRAIAKHYCRVDQATLDEIDGICRRLDPHVSRQLTDHNRDRLRQFDDPDKVARLLRYPEEERARGLTQKNPLRAAKCFERALVAALFIHCTLQIGTLRAINIETDISRTGGKCYLSIDGNRVKNGQPLEFELPDDVAVLLQEYLHEYRPRLAGSDSPYLFPGQDGGPRPHNTVRNDFTAGMRKHAGLVDHPHLIRHAIAKIVVERDPGLYVPMSRQLGHKRIDTTMTHYLGTESRVSGRHINKLLNKALRAPEIPED